MSTRNVEPDARPQPPWAIDIDEDADTFDFGDEATDPGNSVNTSAQHD